ncbi:uncharacterized protein VP01_1187g4 [Puccinia sorghi]|uniref:Retrovirus-related Pol polyprotein from transposon TNT 1-94-like beta-barrel domain-containing protein n=1 Tax=Puccinia sorghi TaxID=27349 RepID=A0A0L6VR48_9BASI|nr:uncharacterized protein VP01_1187g4 [Puccinia sorghi]
MVNDSACFKPHAEANVKISTGGHSNLLYATAIGSAVLINQDGTQVNLDNVLLVPTLSRCLISIPRLFQRVFNVNKTSDNDVMIKIDNNICLQGTTKNNLLELSKQTGTIVLGTQI